MAKKYELLYVLNGTLPADELRVQMDRVRAIVEASAEIVQVTEWGRRRLAYEIQDLREGYYVIVHFNAEAEAPREIERLMRIADYVLRYLIVVAEGSFMPTVRRLSEEGAEEEMVSDQAEAEDSVPAEAEEGTSPDEEELEESVPAETEEEETAPEVKEAEDAGPAEPPEPEAVDGTPPAEVDETPEEPERSEE
ncbi:MAG TPA: 30S ribosomal protein S6 [Bacillota bacterium]|jgi:small subunit ribosomal protein S6|nr:30S ribosomal protein S6 [Fastidiosipila sp.]HPX93715.1 30S ribosomal protein S6 [Bacillota bacterium]HQB81463.1 30S ribosomal protein S6 [Bacillota bacterium]